MYTGFGTGTGRLQLENGKIFHFRFEITSLSITSSTLDIKLQKRWFPAQDLTLKCMCTNTVISYFSNRREKRFHADFVDQPGSK